MILVDPYLILNPLKQTILSEMYSGIHLIVYFPWLFFNYYFSISFTFNPSTLKSVVIVTVVWK